MNKLIFIFTFFCSIAISCVDKKSNALAQAQFLKDTFDFKTIKRGDKADISFLIKNIGKEDVEIKNTSVGCGCTVVKSINNIIKSGETSDIKLAYDSKDDTGSVFKTFVVETNTEPKLTVLYIKGYVVQQ